MKELNKINKQLKHEQEKRDKIKKDLDRVNELVKQYNVDFKALEKSQEKNET